MPVQPPAPIWEEIRDLPAFQRTRSPRYARILGIILLFMLATAVLVLTFVPWQQTAYGEGQLIAYGALERQQVIEAPIEGRVASWHVKEGSEVASGDLVVTLRDIDPQLMQRLEQQREALQTRLQAQLDRASRLEERVAQLREARTTALEAARLRVLMAEERVAAAEQAVEAAQARVETARQNLLRQEELAEEGLGGVGACSGELGGRATGGSRLASRANAPGG